MPHLELLLLEPYYGGSHQLWVDGYTRHSTHNITTLTMPAQAWKWRMQGGAVTLARLFHTQNIKPNIVVASDMLDLSIFRSLTRKQTWSIPHAIYFHENQLTYPQNTRQRHGYRYGFINYASAMSADKLYFNSAFHLDAFFDELPRMLKHFWDYNELETVDLLRRRAEVLALGVDLTRFDAYHITDERHSPPLILWNHRWEEDKNPNLFLQTLAQLIYRGIAFNVAILGENIRHSTPEFDAIREQLGSRLVQFGYVEDFQDYARLLWQSDIVVSTANQEFFGGAVAEAIYCGCLPILPNRLNYPTLIPSDWHAVCLYPHDGALIHTMERILTNPLPATTALQHHIAQFDWQRMAPHYDTAFSQLAQSPE